MDDLTLQQGVSGVLLQILGSRSPFSAAFTSKIPLHSSKLKQWTGFFGGRTLEDSQSCYSRIAVLLFNYPWAGEPSSYLLHT